MMGLVRMEVSWCVVIGEEMEVIDVVVVVVVIY